MTDKNGTYITVGDYVLFDRIIWSNETKRLYISDFLINDTIYEIKSEWTWNKYGKDLALEKNNLAKLDASIDQGYCVILVIEGKEIKYEHT